MSLLPYRMGIEDADKEMYLVGRLGMLCDAYLRTRWADIIEVLAGEHVVADGQAGFVHPSMLPADTHMSVSSSEGLSVHSPPPTGSRNIRHLPLLYPE